MRPKLTGSVAEVLGHEPGEPLARPLATERVSAGFPSPADDFIDKTLDLNELCVDNPAATFFVRAAGDSMTGAGIYDGDILVVDRSKEARPGRVVIAVLEGELTVKRLVSRQGALWLMPENPDYGPTPVGPERELEVWGVVTRVIHKV